MGLLTLLPESWGSKRSDWKSSVDIKRTPAHLMDTILSNLAHAVRHNERLKDAQIQADAYQVGEHARHSRDHTNIAVEHISKLDGWLRTNMPAYAKERDALSVNRSTGLVEDSADLWERLDLLRMLGNE